MELSQTAIDWLLDSDPAIRWQTLRDLTDESDEEVSSQRSRVATEGWGAKLLDLQRPNGGWTDVTEPRTLIETPDGSATHALVLLADMGVDPEHDRVRETVAQVRDNVTHYHAGQPFFPGEVEPCINGKVLRLGAYFGEPSEELLERLLGEQLADGGWNCDAPKSERSSFHSTICVLEGLSELERAVGADERLRNAVARGQDYLLDRRMFRSLSTGEVIDPDWTLFTYPTDYHYDVLRGLDYLRGAGVPADDRVGEAIELVEGNRDSDGLWPLQNPHPEQLEFDMGESESESSRWNTLRALRVLRWAAQ